ncbi:sugar phosphate isomerase/epimerase [Paenibacillus hodogayensis]|uniref:Sugar phosphate isomerase/epimerase n=1 Tax=Paenibacillus hodogayensis TaxID=279208 RepID=A0ABV5VWK0_9BACL
MRIGFYHSCWNHWNLQKTFEWAEANRFSGIELHGGPKYTFADWNELANGIGCSGILSLQEKHDMPITGIMFGALPFLSPSAEERRRAVETIKVLLKAAARLGIPVVSTFTGRDPSLSVEDNLPLVERVFPEVVEFAESCSVTLAFENCPMYEFWPPVHNVAVSPALWREIFNRLPSRRLGLNLDPSHLVWQGIDYVQAVHDFQDRIAIVQAKDTEVLERVLRTEGMMTCKWWRHRIPGQGDVDWNKFIAALHDIGYEGTISIEHEDPIWSGSDARIEQGLLQAKHHLEQFM